MTLNSSGAIKRETLNIGKGDKRKIAFLLNADRNDEKCNSIIQENFNYSGVFILSEKANFDNDFYVSYGCKTITEQMDPLWAVGFLMTLGFFPAIIENKQTVSLSFSHKRISTEHYKETSIKSYYISFILIPVQLFQLFFQKDNNENLTVFVKNTSDRIYYEIPKREAEFAQRDKEILEEEKERSERKAEEKARRESEEKAKRKQKEAEIAERKAKAKKVIIPKGGFYCVHSGFAMGLAADPSRKNFRELELIKGCFEADKPIKAKISELGNNTNIVIVYIGDDEFYSTERLLGLKKRI